MAFSSVAWSRCVCLCDPRKGGWLWCCLKHHWTQLVCPKMQILEKKNTTNVTSKEGDKMDSFQWKNNPKNCVDFSLLSAYSVLGTFWTLCLYDTFSPHREPLGHTPQWRLFRKGNWGIEISLNNSDRVAGQGLNSASVAPGPRATV